MTLKYDQMAHAIRFLSVDAVQKANSGHPGMPMGMADVATVLFSDFLKFNAKDPHWADRDRFVLSAGHGSMLLYSLLYLTGYKDMTLDQLKNFRQLGSKTAGHPEFGHAEGIETTTGPLGQGLANAVGMALTESILSARFGKDIVDHYTYVVVGDGCLMEGISQEAISFAGHQKLNKLIVLFDDNKITIDGSTSLATSENHMKRFEACGWDVQKINGHDVDAVKIAIKKAKDSDKPSMIACETMIGFGSPNKAGTSKVHGSPLGDEEITATRKRLNWPYKPFEIPEDIVSQWRSIGVKHTRAYEDWQNRLSKSDLKGEFNRLMQEDFPVDWYKSLHDLCHKISEEKPKVATRKSSEMVLDVLVKSIPELLGGSADLTGSNNTKAADMKPITPTDKKGTYVYYGIREHAMAAMMNGMALHKGVIPYGGTFLCFTDYCRPSIRLAALMQQRVVFVMTHDSIGLGEDGPTHQPIEHLASLRAIPNLNVFRPADTIETAEAWQHALENKKGPTLIALSRQGLPTVRRYIGNNESNKGGYVLKDAENAKVTLIATGSEVSLAIQVQDVLKAKNIGARVVSMPSTDVFDQQSQEYKHEVLGSGLRVSIEAASTFGWQKYVGDHGLSFGIDRFGASAPAADLYKYYGLTAENISKEIEKKYRRSLWQ
jgi:transketolase